VSKRLVIPRLFRSPQSAASRPMAWRAGRHAHVHHQDLVIIGRFRRQEELFDHQTNLIKETRRLSVEKTGLGAKGVDPGQHSLQQDIGRSRGDALSKPPQFERPLTHRSIAVDRLTTRLTATISNLRLLWETVVKTVALMAVADRSRAMSMALTGHPFSQITQQAIDYNKVF
jgi:hypothetical protein